MTLEPNYQHVTLVRLLQAVIEAQLEIAKQKSILADCYKEMARRKREMSQEKEERCAQ